MRNPSRRTASSSDSATALVVNGVVRSLDRPAGGLLQVSIVDKNTGPDVPLARAPTNQEGRYAVTIPPAVLERIRKTQPDLQAQVYAGETLLASSVVAYNATSPTTLDIELPPNCPGLPSEYETLLSALSALYSKPLSTLEEGGDREDITYLANKTGWDARAVAMAALADQFSSYQVGAPAQRNKRPAPAKSIAAPFYYALFRAGLPANPDVLFHVQSATIQQVWQDAVAKGVIPQALGSAIPGALTTFQQLNASRVLDVTPVAGTSTLRQVLQVSFGDNPAAQQRFADLYAQYGADPTQLWPQVTTAFGAEASTRLQLDGQLAYLTLNNAPLMSALRTSVQGRSMSSLLDLVSNGYYQSDPWLKLLNGLPIPAGDTTSSSTTDTQPDRQSAYAAVMAAQVRLSFPTAVVADQVRTNVFPLNVDPTKLGAVKQEVQGFLAAQQGAFEIGLQSIEQFLAANKMQGQISTDAVEQIKRLQRVYQITPHDTAMAGLLNNGLDSAYKIVAYSHADFMAHFSNALGDAESAAVVYAKARQVHAAVLSLATHYLVASTAPAVGRHSPAGSVDPVPSRSDGTGSVPAYATLEKLLGSMDFCACEECRSLLSPAAYLVDLLNFIDYDPSDGTANPLKVLLDRRPDIGNVALTCENTNGVISAIDQTNEVLEYFVWNAKKNNTPSLANFAGFNTDPATSPAELLSSPQFVNDSAYAYLQLENFPPPLPFNRGLEALRQYFTTLGAPLVDAMECLLVDPNAVDRVSTAGYGWRDIMMEAIGLSREEYGLLTDLDAAGKPNARTLNDLYGYDAGVDAVGTLSNLQAFTRRVGVTYADAIDLLKTKFINPSGHLLPKLERLGVPFTTIQGLKVGSITPDQFLASIATGLDPAEYGGDIVKWVSQDNYDAIMALITIANPTTPGDLSKVEQLEFRYANPDATANKLHNIDFIRFHRLIRLWKKLGWSIELTDKAIGALFPAANLPLGKDEGADLTNLNTGLGFLVLRLGVVCRLLHDLSLRPTDSLLPLLSCWSPIDTYGDASLYSRLFLSPAPGLQDQTFLPDAYGDVLQGTTAKLVDKQEVVCAALRLTGDEFTLIMKTLGFDGSTSLSLDNVSAIYRRGWLARTFRLSVRELLTLIQSTGWDPFAAPPEPPNPPVIRLLQLIDRLRTAGIQPQQVLYLLWNQDLSGRSTPDNTVIAEVARTLRGVFVEIDNEFAVPTDADGSIAHDRMCLVYGNDVTDEFFSFLNNSLASDETYGNPKPTLDPAVLQAAPGLAYDDLRKRLSYTGVPPADLLNKVQQVVGISPVLVNAIQALVTKIANTLSLFFNAYKELQPIYDVFVSSAQPDSVKWAALVASLFPLLVERRRRQQAIQTAAGSTRAEVDLVGGLLENNAALCSSGDSTKPGIGDLVALASDGLSCQIFYADTATGAPDLVRGPEAVLEYSTDTNPLPPNLKVVSAPISGIWKGFVEAPSSGFFDLEIDTDGATVTLSIDGSDCPLTQSGSLWSNNAPIELTAGTLYEIELTVEKARAVLAVRWETTGQAYSVIPSQYLYDDRAMTNLHVTYVRLLKGASLATALKTTPAEFLFLAADSDYAVGPFGWVGSLPVLGAADQQTAKTLADVLTGMLDFASLKAALAPQDERLLMLLQDPSAPSPDGTSLLSSLTGWGTDLLPALSFVKSQSDLTHIATFARVFDVAALVKQCLVSAPSLVAAVTNAPAPEQVRAFQGALRARYATNDWLAAVKPINDALRKQQRDALVAYAVRTLAPQGWDTSDRLFEYFLMDVAMEPCMETSRIRSALSAVQLFVDRCLMNLENTTGAVVSPSSIGRGQPQQWEWMKRYRVWEANRKVFIWPENWLEPELRDDQSSLFKEMMSELLQHDITDDAAQIAYLNYLSKLEEVAKLEPCGMYFEEVDGGQAHDAVHVIARTSGAHRKYFYRRLEGGSWNAWEQMKLEIEGNPVIPVVWRDRLFAFWLKVMKHTPMAPPDSQQPPPDPNATTLAGLSLPDLKQGVVSSTPAPGQVSVGVVLCYSEFYNGKWQAMKTSDPDDPALFATGDPATLVMFPAFGEGAFDRGTLRLAVLGERDTGALRVQVSDDKFPVTFSVTFSLFNSHSLPTYDPTGGDTPSICRRDVQTDQQQLTIVYYPGSTGPVAKFAYSEPVLSELPPSSDVPLALDCFSVAPFHRTTSPWSVPFLFGDVRHLFYVTTDRIPTPAGFYTRYGVPPAGSIAARIGSTMMSQVPQGAGPRVALMDTSTVSYGGRQFGPQGVVRTEVGA